MAQGIPRSSIAGFASLCFAALVHGSFVLSYKSAPVEIAGGNTALAMAGTSFADLAVGVASGSDHAGPVSPKSPDRVVAPAASKPQLNAPMQPVERTVQRTAAQAQTTAVADTAQTTAPKVTQRPVQNVASRPRPKPATPQLVKPTPEPKPVPKERARQPAARGNSDQASTKGRNTGQAERTAGQAERAPGKAVQQGNAAADDYRGKVLRRIQRAKRQSVNIRGTALVQFSITSSGSIGSAAIAKSSGSAKLDSVALAQVRRAGPFPSPPPGARTRYSVRIKGK
ncbi:TonB family protein [Phaeobacter sp. C3_T13_0]|uniref:TonB family protein n=1 Tax=Phaeobacter cretensis TaxID=3342641 RepID=UPI0039BD8D88